MSHSIQSKEDWLINFSSDGDDDNDYCHSNNNPVEKKRITSIASPAYQHMENKLTVTTDTGRANIDHHQGSSIFDTLIRSSDNSNSGDTDNINDASTPTPPPNTDTKEWQHTERSCDKNPIVKEEEAENGDTDIIVDNERDDSDITINSGHFFKKEIIHPWGDIHQLGKAITANLSASEKRANLIIGANETASEGWRQFNNIAKKEGGKRSQDYSSTISSDRFKDAYCLRMLQKIISRPPDSEFAHAFFNLCIVATCAGRNALSNQATQATAPLQIFSQIVFATKLFYNQRD